MAESTPNPLTSEYYGDERVQEFIERYFVGVKAKLINGKLELSGTDSSVKKVSKSFFPVDVDVHRKQLIIAEKSTLRFLNDQLDNNNEVVILVVHVDKQDVYTCTHIPWKKVRQVQLETCSKLIKDNIILFKLDKSNPDLNSVIEKILFSHSGKVIKIPSGEPMLVFTKDIEESIRNQLDEPKKGRPRHNVVQTPHAVCGEDAFQSFLKKYKLGTNKDLQIEVHDLQLDSRREQLILTDDKARSFINKKLYDNDIACYLTSKEESVVGNFPAGYRSHVEIAITIIHENVCVIENADFRDEILLRLDGKVTAIVQEQRTCLVFTKDIEKEVMSFLERNDQNEVTEGNIEDKSRDHKDREVPIQRHEKNMDGTPPKMPSHDKIGPAQDEKNDVTGNIMEEQTIDPENDAEEDRFNYQRESKLGHNFENETGSDSYNSMIERESKARRKDTEEKMKQKNETGSDSYNSMIERESKARGKDTEEEMKQKNETGSDSYNSMIERESKARGKDTEEKMKQKNETGSDSYNSMIERESKAREKDNEEEIKQIKGKKGAISSHGTYPKRRIDGQSDENYTGCDVVEVIQVNTDLAKYLFSYKKSEIENLEIQFGCDITNDEGTITVGTSGRHGNKGKETTVSSKGHWWRVIEKINEMARQYWMTSFHIEEENLTAFSEAVNRLRSKEKDTQVTTFHCNQPKIVETFVIKGVNIHLVQGSAVDLQQADAILCPLGSKYNPECAAAEQIISKGGESLREILTISATNRKSLHNLGIEIFKLTGDLPFRAMCGMVLEDWYTKTKHDERNIPWKLKEAFDGLVANICSSIAVPLEVGQRIPVMSMAKACCSAVNLFIYGRPSSVLRTISLCVVNDACIQSLCDLLRGQFQPGPKTEPSPSSEVATPTDIYGPSTVRVSLKTGSLTDQRVEAIVVPTNDRLDLSQGLISKSVGKAAGESIEKELKEKKPQGIGPMEVTHTGPGKLQLKSILYSKLPRMDDGYGPPEKCVGMLMKNIFKLAKDLKITSIALPGNGTGGLQYPDDVVAMEIVRSIYLLASRCGIKNVSIVLYKPTSDQHKIFEKAVGEYHNSVKMTCKALKDYPSYIEVVNDKRGNRYTILESITEVPMCDVMIVLGMPAFQSGSDVFFLGDTICVQKVKENLSRCLLRAKIYLHILSHELDMSKNKELYMKALQYALEDLDCQFLVIDLEYCHNPSETKLIIDRFLRALDDLLHEDSRLLKLQFIVRGETFKSLVKMVKDQDHEESESFIAKYIPKVFKGSSNNVWRLFQPKCHISSGAYVTVCSDHEGNLRQVYALKSSVRSHGPNARGARLDDYLSGEGRTHKQSIAENPHEMYPKHPCQRQDEPETFSDLPNHRQRGGDGHSRGRADSPDRSFDSDSRGDFYEDAEMKLFEERSGVLPTSTVRHMSSHRIEKFMTFFNGKSMKADLIEDKIKFTIPNDKATEFTSMVKTVLSNLDKTVYYIHDVKAEINHLLRLHFKKMGSLDQSDWSYLSSEEKIKVERYKDVYNQVRRKVLAFKRCQYQMDTLDVSKTKLSLEETLQSFRDQEEFEHVFVEPMKDSIAINIHYPIDQQDKALKVKTWLQVKLELIKTTGRRNRRFDNYTSLQIDGGQETGNNTGTTSREGTECSREELSGRSMMKQSRHSYSFSLSMPASQKEPLQRFTGYTKEIQDDSTEAVYCTEKKLVIKVYKGDIKNLKVDCIVNAANEDLFHRAGIAAVIDRAAGRDFARECRDFIRDNGKLHVNQCISTTAGNLSYRYVLHAVGPMWGMYKDKGDCADELMQTIVNILLRAECLDIKSVAIPSISAGIFGVPWDVCAQQYARGVRTFEEVSKGVVKEVHFIDNNEKILNEIRSVFNLMFQLFEERSGVLPTSLVRHMSSHRIEKFMTFFNGKIMKADLIEDEIKFTIPNDKATEFTSMMKTVLSNLDKTVYYIHDVKPEINHLLKLHFKKMGSLDQSDWSYLSSEEKIKVEWYEDVYNQVRGEALAFKRCQYQMDMLDVSKTKLSLEETLQSFRDQEEFEHVLVEPTKDSNAINIHYPIDQQDKALKVKTWLQVKLKLIKTTRQRNRRFDNYTTLQIDGGQETGNNTGTTSREGTECSREELSGRSMMRQNRHSYSFSLSMPASQKECLQRFTDYTKEIQDDSTEAVYCTEKKRVIKVYKGDIKNLKVDCIVNAANEDLFHGAGIAAVIDRAAGRDFARECRDFIRDNGRLHVNQCISTTAGNLSYRYVLHAVGPMWGMYKDKGDCADELMQTIVNILRRAECLDMKSVAIPSISTGIFGVPWDVCAQQYARGVRTFEEVSKGVVKEVHFIDNNEKILNEIRSLFNLMFQVQKSSDF